MSSAVLLSGVEKRCPGFLLSSIDLKIESGTALALIGPNGAGKTTLMDLLAGMLAPSNGRIEILGHSPAQADASWKAAIGYVSEQQPFYENWSGARNLAFLARFFPTWSLELQAALAQRFDLPLEKKVKALSKGNRVKLALVAALARRPRLLLRTDRDDLENSWRLLTFRLDPLRLSAPTVRLLLDHQVQGLRNLAVSWVLATLLILSVIASAFVTLLYDIGGMSFAQIVSALLVVATFVLNANVPGFGVAVEEPLTALAQTPLGVVVAALLWCVLLAADAAVFVWRGPRG